MDLEEQCRKVKTIDGIKSITNFYKGLGKKLVWTNGCFDILHIGHVRILNEAKSYGDMLVVGMNSDKSVKRSKGNNRPIINETERAEMLASLQCVDYVLIYDEDEPLRYLEILKPDVKVKGGSYIEERVVKEDAIVKCYGGRCVYLPMNEDYSTTNLINRILEVYGKE